MPWRRAASPGDVAAVPARCAARAITAAAARPAARRLANSITSRPRAATTNRDALVAAVVASWIVASVSVSKSEISVSEAVIWSSGSPEKTGVPSAGARTEPVKR